MKKMILFTCLFLLINCSNKKDSLDIEVVKELALYKTDIKSYNKDSIQSFKNILIDNSKIVKPILNDLHLMIFQAPDSIDTLLNENTYYLYNVQNSSETSYYISVIGTDENWTDRILLLKYSKENGVLVNKFILAEYNPNPYHLVEIESNFIENLTYNQKKITYKYDPLKHEKKMIDTLEFKVEL